MSTRHAARTAAAFLLGFLGAAAFGALALSLAPRPIAISDASSPACTYNGAPIACRAAGGTWSSLLDCYATGTITAPTSSGELAIVNEHNSGPAYPAQPGHWVQCVAGMLGTRFTVAVPVFVPDPDQHSSQEAL